MKLLLFFKRFFVVITLCCAIPAIAMYNDEIRRPSCPQPCVRIDIHECTHYKRSLPCNAPDEIDFYSCAVHCFHLKAFQEIKKRPDSNPPTTVSATINTLMEMAPHDLQTLAQESYTESLSCAHCCTTLGCCLLAGTLASALYQLPVITDTPTCSEAALPLAKTVCILACGGCGVLCSKKEADNNYRNAKDWKRLLYPQVINMPNTNTQQQRKIS
jgi:hypothetical protein